MNGAVAGKRLRQQARGAALAAAASLIFFATDAVAGPRPLQPDATSMLERAAFADFGNEAPSAEARDVAGWIVETHDNGALPFVIVDKRQARVFVFDARGQLRGAAPALLGLTIGDEASPNVGERPLSRIRPSERTTQAGRFNASLGSDLQGQQLLWVDYDSGLALHRVVSGQPRDQRRQRLATPTPLDNRITYGCINVPGALFDAVVAPLFAPADGVVYVLPETRPARAFFIERGADGSAGP